MNETLQPFEHLAELLAALITAIRGRIDECMALATTLVAAITKFSEAPEVVAVKIDHSVTTICWTAGGCAVALLIGLIYHAHVSRAK
jgi:hypothetical protein